MYLMYLNKFFFLNMINYIKLLKLVYIFDISYWKVKIILYSNLRVINGVKFN